jgi:hypothetical protein
MKKLLLFGLLAASIACSSPSSSGSFTLSLTPSQVSLIPRGVAQVNVTLTRGGDFTGDVDVQLENAPTGYTAQTLVIPAGSTNALLKIQADDTVQPGSNTNLQVKGVAGSLSSQAQQVAVSVAPFTLAVVPSSLNVEPGSTTKATVIVGRLTGFNDAVEISLTGLPARVSAQAVTVKSGQSSADLIIKADWDAPTTSAPIEITLNSSVGSFTQALKADLNVGRSLASPLEIKDELASFGLNLYSSGSYGSTFFDVSTNPFTVAGLGVYAEMIAGLKTLGFPSVYVYTPPVTTASIPVDPLGLTKLIQAFAPAPQDLRALGLSIPESLNRLPRSTSTTLLPSGVFDCTTGTCPTLPVTNDDLIIRWRTPNNQDAALTFDWDGSSDGTASAPVKAFVYSYVSGTTTNTYYQMLPTKLRATLMVGTTKLLDGALDVTWRAKANEPGIYEQFPTMLSVKGFLARTDGTHFVDVPVFNWQSANTGLIVNADVTTSAAGNPAHILLSATLPVLLGNPTTILNTSGKFALDFRGMGRSLALSFNLSNVHLQDPPRSTEISDGVLSLNGKAMTFSGKLDDQNENCIPGENLTLHFSGGNVPLEVLFLSLSPSSYTRITCAFTSPPATAPTNFRATSVTANSVSLAWDAVAKAEYYAIEKRNNANQSLSLYYCYYSSATSCTDYISNYPEQRGQTVTYIVKAINGGGAGPTSNLSVAIPAI